MTQPLAHPRLALGLQEASFAQPAATTELTEILNRYGVAVVLGTSYEWGGYLHSTAGDAIAAARRNQIKEKRQ